ncbi:hypothetical protein [Thermosynechococcus sp.]|uniref:hypothetical protein n=1 Tax=Thermosynechococcus sp. TaxID=2814275 RepID=UPI003919C092
MIDLSSEKTPTGLSIGLKEKMQGKSGEGFPLSKALLARIHSLVFAGGGKSLRFKGRIRHFFPFFYPFKLLFNTSGFTPPVKYALTVEIGKRCR